MVWSHGRVYGRASFAAFLALLIASTAQAEVKANYKEGVAFDRRDLRPQSMSLVFDGSRVTGTIYLPVRCHAQSLFAGGELAIDAVLRGPWEGPDGTIEGSWTSAPSTCSNDATGTPDPGTLRVAVDKRPDGSPGVIVHLAPAAGGPGVFFHYALLGKDFVPSAAQGDAAAQGGAAVEPDADRPIAETTQIGEAIANPPSEPANRPAAVLVLDVSNSMWGQIEGKPKVEIAREAITSLLGSWDPNVDLGLVAYGHNRASDCTDIETLRPVGPLDPASFAALVNNLTPRGKTPLTEAVRRAAGDLSLRDRPASVLLFSDGIETCGGDPCALAAELKRAGVQFTAHVIGFSVAADEKQLACLAETTGGLFLSADTAPQLQQALQTVASRAANPVATDLVTLEALDAATGEPITGGLVWTVTSISSEDLVPLTAGVARPALPLPPGQYVAEAALGAVAGRASFDVVAKQAQTVQVRLGGNVVSGAQTAELGLCAEPNNEFGSPARVDLAGGITDSIYPQGDVDFCSLEVAAPGILSMLAVAVPQPLDLVARVNDVDRRPVLDWTSALVPGAAPMEADLPQAGRYVLEIADAYHDASAAAPFTLGLAFAAAVDATEPNESLTRPATLPPGPSVDVAIFPKGEHNFLAIEVEDQGELTVTASAVPKPIDAAMRLFGPDHALLKDWQSSAAGVDLAVTADLPASGRYVIELADSYDDARSPQPLKLTAAFKPSPDAGEPNNTTAQAAGLPLDTPTPITILPRGDHDFFLIDAPHRGRLTASATGVAGIEVAIRLLDGNRQIVRDWTAAPAPAAPFTFEADLPAPGKYWLEVADSYDDGRSVEAITVNAALSPAEDAMEPNDRPRDAKPMQLGVPVQASILPRGDHDFFEIEAAAAALTLRATQAPVNIDVALRILDANLDMVGNWIAAPAAGAEAELRIELPKAGRYWLEVADSYDDASAPAAFTLEARQE